MFTYCSYIEKVLRATTGSLLLDLINIKQLKPTLKELQIS